MKIDNLKSIKQVEDFLAGSQAIAFSVATSKDERYQFVEKILKQFRYQQLKRREKGIAIQFIIKVTD
jgi:hypothetical protein